MSKFDKKVEQTIIEKGLTAPRVTTEQIDELMKGVTYIENSDG